MASDHGDAAAGIKLRLIALVIDKVAIHEFDAVGDIDAQATALTLRGPAPIARVSDEVAVSHG